MLKTSTFFCFTIICIACSHSTIAAPLQAISNHQQEACDLPGEVGPRFIKLDGTGEPLSNQQASYKSQSWVCVLDRNTNLIWEVKTTYPGLHHQNNLYSWYNSDSTSNGGHPGFANKGSCANSSCDTQAFIGALNSEQYCGREKWRIPQREELRSLIRYDSPFPGPTVNRHYFPNTLSQFFWSASADSDNRDSVWGIGFSFGFDYTYIKSHAGYVRAVSSNRRSNIIGKLK